MLNRTPLRETRAPWSGIRRTAKLASLGNTTLEVAKAGRLVIMWLIAPLAGTCWTRSGRGSRTQTSTAPPGELENNVIGFLGVRLGGGFLPPHPFVQIADDVEACATHESGNICLGIAMIIVKSLHTKKIHSFWVVCFIHCLVRLEEIQLYATVRWPEQNDVKDFMETWARHIGLNA